MIILILFRLKELQSLLVSSVNSRLAHLNFSDSKSEHSADDDALSILHPFDTFAQIMYRLFLPPPPPTWIQPVKHFLSAPQGCSVLGKVQLHSFLTALGLQLLHSPCEGPFQEDFDTPSGYESR